MIETHAHYDDEQFEIDRDTVIKRVYAEGVEKIITIGCDVKSSKSAIDLANKYDFIYASIGVHPDEIGKSGSLDDVLGELYDMAIENKKVVAIGEIGLDYYHDISSRDVQKLWFDSQIKLARKLNLPIICHIRDAFEDSVNVLRDNLPCDGACHCFSGSLETAQIYLNMGFYLGFDGPITFKNSKKCLDVISKIPLEKILIETDSPYLSPEPNRGKRNDSSNLKYIIEKMADIKGLSYNEIEKITTQNAKELFKL